jgi:hypothetical protein
MSYISSAYRWDSYAVWNLIVGVQYVTVGSYAYDYAGMLEQLREDLGDEFKKPVVLLSLNQMPPKEYRRLVDLDMIDYEYGV